MNQGKVRQPGTVSQRYLSLRLIRGKRHAEQSLTVTGDLAHDRIDIIAALVSLRGALDDLPDDPHLDYAIEVRSSRTVEKRQRADSERNHRHVLDAAHGLDLVGIYAAGARLSRASPIRLASAIGTKCRASICSGASTTARTRR